jgi:hypothetical protein
MEGFDDDNDGAVTPDPMKMTREGQVHRLRSMPEPVNVGPFSSTAVPDSVRGGTVGQDGIPCILYEARIKVKDGIPQKEEKYAIMVPPRKDIGLVCAGCYDPKMTLFDISRCVSCRTFANHLDTKTDGSRKRLCVRDEDIDHSLKSSIGRAKDVRLMAPGGVVDLKDVPAGDLVQALKGVIGKDAEHTNDILAEVNDCDLLHALKGRHPDGLAGYLNHIEDEDIVSYLDNIHIKDLKDYIKKRDKVGRQKRALKSLR